MHAHTPAASDTTAAATSPAEFAVTLAEWPAERIRRLMDASTAADVETALRGAFRTPERALAALLSPAAEPHLEALARRGAAITRQRFGRVMQFYAPLYVSNVCVNSCVYCGFNCRNRIARKRLTVAEAVAEAEYLAREGFRHLLLVAGEDPHGVPVAYFEELAGRLRGRFASIGIEIYPLPEADYARLVKAGVDLLTIYQETYDRGLYAELHPAGPKRDFDNRLAAVEAGARAGMAFLGVGALQGLNDWRVENFHAGLHALWLQRRFWRASLSLSFPRIRPAAGAFQPRSLVDDRALVQILCALRIVLPDAALVLSTREPAALRDRLALLGITRMSAGSRTNPGGYTADAESAEGQFSVADERGLAEMRQVLAGLGFDPVCKDWDAAYHAAG